MDAKQRFNLMINAMMDEYDVWSEVEIPNEIDAMPETVDVDAELADYQDYLADVDFWRKGC